MSFFQKQFIPKKSLFKKIFRLPERRYFLLALENLFASKGLAETNWQEVDALYKDYHIRPSRDEVEGRIKMLRRYLVHCFADHQLSDEEIAQIALLKKYLKLTENQIQRAKDEASRQVYKEAFADALSDHKINDNERLQLEKLGELLHLDIAVREQIQKEKTNVLVQRVYHQVIADERVSDQELALLERLQQNLGVDVNMETESKQLFDRYRLYWKLENAPLEPVDVSINLFKGEHCYFESPCSWYEYRSVTKRYNYAGPTFRLKLAKGLYYRAGSMRVQPVREEELQLLDQGHLFLTDRRLIFMGSRKNRTHRFSTILDFDTYGNGLELMRSSGRNAFLEISAPTDICSLIFGRLLEEY
jgi:hypothetical protein